MGAKGETRGRVRSCFCRLEERLLFFKRASDLYREELEAAREELGDVVKAEELARGPAFHVLLVPEGPPGRLPEQHTQHAVTSGERDTAPTTGSRFSSPGTANPVVPLRQSARRRL